MLKLSARTIVIIAAICFIGLVVLQVTWIRSAYDGEVALYTQQKRQLETGLQMHLRQDEVFKSGLKQMIDHYISQRRLTPQQQTWFIDYLKPVIDSLSNQKQPGAYVPNFGIVQHAHADSDADINAVLLLKNERLTRPLLSKAGTVCIHCILGLPESKHQEYNYELLLIYQREQAVIYSRLSWLIAASFILLLALGLLFQQMIKKYRQERKLSEAKNDFINNLSHEIQTPVFAVQMANKLIKEKANQQQDIRPLTEIIEKETSQLKQHASKILELASLESDEYELHKEVVDLSDFIEAKRATIELMLQNKNGKLDIYYHNAALHTELDKVHFNNVLISLVENAIKYNEEPPHIRIETNERGEMACLSVTDNGMGIEQADLPYVFDKFYRAPGVKANGTHGFGLGLSYVKQVVQLHKGQVQITSASKKGTTVTVLLPKSHRHV